MAADSMFSLLPASPQELWALMFRAPELYASWWTNLYREAPHHVWIETSLLVFIFWLTFIRKTVDPAKSTYKVRVSKEEEEMLIRTWEPEPLVPTKRTKAITAKNMTIEAIESCHIKVQGQLTLINLSTFDFLGLAQHPDVKRAAQQAMEKYGCGSCGPRGFYGTIDVHLSFEKAIAKFMGAAEAICYSDGASSLSSYIPAFAKKGDLLLVDEACCEPIATGLILSRATVIYFKHNDMQDLENILEGIAADDRRLGRDSTQQRRFIVVEGVYRSTGQLCSLPKVLSLKEKYCYRLFLDESLSFGILGKCGRGITEHFGVDASVVEFLNISLETVLGSTGGVCVGTREVVDHQRLSGAGYCFSAAAPPFFSSAAIEALRIIETQSELRAKLSGNIEMVRVKLTEGLGENFVLSPEPAAVIHITLNKQLDYEVELNVMSEIAKQSIENGVAVVCKGDLDYLKNSGVNLRPSVRIIVNSMLGDSEIYEACEKFCSAAHNAYHTVNAIQTAVC